MRLKSFAITIAIALFFFTGILQAAPLPTDMLQLTTKQQFLKKDLQSIVQHFTIDNAKVVTRQRQTIYHTIKLDITPKIRTVSMIAMITGISLLAASISNEIGTETSRPLTRVIIDEILYAMMFSLYVFHSVFDWIYRKRDEND
ncbi:Cu/Ag efflux pump CusA [Pedobacter cryoconitis]|uniref:Cu/Ag efflux pump CusA n=1 Tax=Pedobacter cryoconitis TaxID=188932 RepID=A0A7W8ZQT3_9SPHI|nr:hypothetical protein [Pedobacter cryoconitis]MBB5638270.1 Cu/Ag efflux pump CusA [Pedobacter cryoconitis]